MALSVGTQAPDFSLLDTDMNPVKLSDFSGKKVILVFFPAAFTGVCEAELCSFQRSITRLNDMNAQVVAVSADLPFANKGFKEKFNLDFPLLSDWDLNTIKSYDILFNGFAGIEGLQRSERATFVLAPGGEIKHVHVTENPGVEPDYEEIYKAAEAI